jgi:hypothetical protein
MRILTRREARIVAALAETMFPEGGRLVGAREAKVVEAVDAFMAEVGPIERGMMHAMFALFEVSIGIPFLGSRGGARRFTKADLDQRRHFISRWETSDLYLKRLGFQALRSTFLIAYLHSGEVLEGIGVEDGEAALERWRRRKGLVSGRVSKGNEAEDVTPLHVRQQAGRGR